MGKFLATGLVIPGLALLMEMLPTESGAIAGNLGIYMAYMLVSSGHLPLMNLILLLAALGEGLVARVAWAQKLVAPYRAMFRYYCCDTPYRVIPSSFPPKWCGTPALKMTQNLLFDSYLSHFQVVTQKSHLSHFGVTLIILSFGVCSWRPHSQPLVLSFKQVHLCDTPFCNISRGNCAMPCKNKHQSKVPLKAQKCHPNADDGRRDSFSGRKFRITLQRQIQIQFLSHANWNCIVDAEMVSCCLHVLVLAICCRFNCGDGGIRGTLQMQRQI